MKKKSPPYAIIGAAVLGIIAVIVYLQHEKAVQQQFAEAQAKMQADAAAALAAANSKVAPTTVVEPTPTNMRKVLYATQPIDPGVRISPSFFETKLTPNDVMPDAYTPDTDVAGWFALRNIEKGDPLTPRNVGKDLPFMEGRITPGMRAISLQIFNGGDVNNTGGFVIDGDKVDLLMTRVTPDGSTQIDTQMIMQNLTVLYVPGPPNRTEKTQGVNPIPSPGGGMAVTFEVTPEQAQALLSLAHGKNVQLSMILRSRRDNTEVKVKPFVGGDYFQNPKKIQKMTDTSIARVQDLQKQIEDAEAKNKAQGNTNAPPTPPSP